MQLLMCFVRLLACCYGSADSDTLPVPDRTQHIFNEIALGGRSVVNLWSAVFNGYRNCEGHIKGGVQG